MKRIWKRLISGAAVLAMSASVLCAAPLQVHAGTLPQVELSAALLVGSANLGMEITVLDSETNSNILENPRYANATFWVNEQELTPTEDKTFILAADYNHMDEELTLQAKFLGRVIEEKKTTINECLQKVLNETQDAGVKNVVEDVQAVGSALAVYRSVKKGGDYSAALTAQNVSDATVTSVLSEAKTDLAKVEDGSCSPRNNTALNAAFSSAHNSLSWEGHTLSIEGDTISYVSVYQNSGLDSNTAENTVKGIVANLTSPGSEPIISTENGFVRAETPISGSLKTNGHKLTVNSQTFNTYASQYVASAIAKAEGNSATGRETANGFAAAAIYNLGESIAAYSATQTEQPEYFQKQYENATLTCYNDPAEPCANLKEKMQEVVDAGYGAVALTDDDYENYVGGWIEVTVPSEGVTFQALVVDLMPKAEHPGKVDGDVDLVKSAFEKLLPAGSSGELAVTWKPIESPIKNDTLQIKFKKDSKRGWGAINLEGYKLPIKSVKLGDTELVKMTNEKDQFVNYYTVNSFGTADTCTFTFTDVLGDTFQVEVDCRFLPSGDTGISSDQLVEATIVS